MIKIMPNQYDNINKDYLTHMIKARMEEFGHTNDGEMFDRIYKRICEPDTQSTEKYIMTDEDKIVSLASGDYDCGMEMDAYIMWAIKAHDKQ